jgi:hypothetical protein
MSIPIEFIKTDDELLLADILVSWSIEDVAKLVEEMGPQLSNRPASPCGVFRSRRAIASHQALQHECGSRRSTRKH